MNLKEMLQRRAELITQNKAVLERAESEGRQLHDDERLEWDRRYDDVEKLTGDIRRAQSQQEQERARMAAAAAEGGDSDGEPVARATGEGGREYRNRYGQLGLRDDATPPAFRARVMEFDERASLPLADRRSAAYEDAYSRFLSRGAGALTGTELRALQADADELGGYMVAPERFIMRLIKFLDDAVFVRQYATVESVQGADGLGAASLDADPDDADWTTELGTGSEDSTMDFGKREWKPNPLAKRIKVSRRLIRKSTDVEGLVIQRLGYKFAVTEEKAFLTGHGAGRPLGAFVASALGISTGRDVSTGNTTTAVTFDGIINAKYQLKGGYWRNARWMFHRDGMKMIAKLKDGDGQYLWRESVRAGEPDTVAGLPFDMSEFAPNTFTTGQYVGILADWSFYWIADDLNMTIQRLDELYAETNQIGFIGRKETDGMPVLEEAFARVTLA